MATVEKHGTSCIHWKSTWWFLIPLLLFMFHSSFSTCFIRLFKKDSKVGLKLSLLFLNHIWTSLKALVVLPALKRRLTNWKLICCRYLRSVTMKVRVGWRILDAAEYNFPKSMRYRTIAIFDALRDLVPFVQFKKREKHPWGSVNFKLQASLQHY